MKRTIHILFCILLSLNLYGQDSSPAAKNKIEISIRAGVYYKTFFDTKYIEPKPYNYEDKFTDHQYERFNKTPTVGFSAGMLFTYRFNPHWGISSGLVYFLRKDIFEKNQDTVIKYGNGSSLRDIHNVLEYNYSFNNLEVPLLFQYSAKKISLSTGCYFALLTYKKTTYTYVINQNPSNPQWGTADKAISGFEIPLKLFPTFQMSYEIAFKNVNLNPYLAFYYAINNQNDFYTQLGISLSLDKQNQNHFTNH